LVLDEKMTIDLALENLHRQVQKKQQKGGV